MFIDIHFKNITRLEPEDKYSKIRSLMDHLNENFVEAFCEEQKLDVHESDGTIIWAPRCKQLHYQHKRSTAIPMIH